MTWAARRKAQYLLGFFGFLAVIAFIFLYPIIFKKATCFDGKKNSNEVEVDCGGSCSRFCLSQVSAPVVLWSRAFPLVADNYNLVAFIENKNKNAAVADVSYEFKMYDNNNLLIGRRTGNTFIPPNQQFAIFESKFNAGENKIKSVTFEFTSTLVWVTKEPTLNTLPIRVDNVIYEEVGFPSLSARFKNDSIFDLPEFEVVSILYDKDHNAINASQTYKEGLMSNQNTSLLFTWPEKFLETPVTEEILPLINPFSVSF